MLTYADFKRRHPSYDPDYWELCRLLNLGGKDLLKNDKVMRVVMPQHPAEPDGQYKIRRIMSAVENLSAPVLDFISSGLSQDPLRMEGGPAFFEDFDENTAPVGGRACTLNELALSLVHSVMLYGRGWARCDLPRDAGPYANEAAQEAAGALRAYMVPLAPECVVDWEETEDGSGQLAWALTMERRCRRASLAAARNMVTERYTEFTADTFQVFEFTYDAEKNPDGPKDSELPSLVLPVERHSFKRVPILRMEPTEQARGLYAMALIEPLARRHIDATNALDYAEARVLFTPRTVFLDPGSSLDGAEAADPQAVVSQPQGTATVISMKAAPGAGDRVEYPAPPTEVFVHALKAKKERVDGVSRLMHLVRLSVEQTASAVGRSGESKKADHADSAVVMGAFGLLVRTFFRTEAYPMLARGRGDGEIEFQAFGMAKFDPDNSDEILSRITALASAPIPSPTAMAEIHMQAVRALVPGKSEEWYETCEGELEDAHAHEAAAQETEVDNRIDTPSPAAQLAAKTPEDGGQ